MFVRLLPIIISTFLFAAHVMRFNGLLPALLVLVSLATLMIRKPWVPRLWQALLLIAIIVWVDATIDYVKLRLALNASWARLLIIMSAIILFNVLSLVWLENKIIKHHYQG